MIPRRRFLTGFVIASAPLGGAAHAQEYKAQPAGKIHRIGVLDDSSAATASVRIESLRKGLRDLGLIEGQNVKIEWRFAEGKEAALSTLAMELAGLTPDVLVSSTGVGLAALHSATTAIPIVVAGADTGCHPPKPCAT